MTAALLPKYPSKNPDTTSRKDKIKENIRGFKNNCGKNPRDKPLGKNPNLLSPNPKTIIKIDAAKADTTLKNTP